MLYPPIMGELRLKALDRSEKYRIEGRIAIGRHHTNDLIIPSEQVSRHHCVIDVDDEGHVTVTDLGSANGTLINGKSIESVRVVADDRLTVGPEQFVFVAASLTDTAEAAAARLQSFLDISERIEGVELLALDDPALGCSWPAESIFTIGRLEFSDLSIDDEAVSRNHATLEVRRDRVVLSDTNSTNGTYVNDERILRKALADGDIVSIAGRFDFRVGFRLDRTGAPPFVTRLANMSAIDGFAALPTFVDTFREDYGEQIPAEVERQTLLLCEELSHLLARRGSSPTEKGVAWTRFVGKLARTERVLDGKALREHVETGRAFHTVSIEFLRQAYKINEEQAESPLLFLEQVSQQAPSRIEMNGVVVRRTADAEIFAFEIPRPSALYLVYASRWLSSQT